MKLLVCVLFPVPALLFFAVRGAVRCFKANGPVAGGVL